MFSEIEHPERYKQARINFLVGEYRRGTLSEQGFRARLVSLGLSAGEVEGEITHHRKNK